MYACVYVCMCVNMCVHESVCVYFKQWKMENKFYLRRTNFDGIPRNRMP